MTPSPLCPGCRRDLPADEFFRFDREGRAHRVELCRVCRRRTRASALTQEARIRVSLMSFDGEDAAEHAEREPRKRTPEERLALAVLTMAVRDLASWRLRKSRRTVWRDAYDFFLHPKDRWRLQVWCEAAGEEEQAWVERGRKALEMCKGRTVAGLTLPTEATSSSTLPTP